MAATSTLRQLLIELTERNGLGVVVPVASNTTTTFTLTTTGSPELRGPFSGRKIAIGSPVVCTVETSGTSALGNRTYVSDWNPSTGVLTVSPAVGDTDVTEIIIFNPDIGDPDRPIEAINRALLNRCDRWQKVSCTFVPDGDLLGGTVADFWTASAGTAAYSTLAVPEVAGQRAVQITHSSTANITGNTIPARAGEVWEFETAIRATTDGDTAALTWRDIVAGADITVSYYDGDGSTTSRGFITQRGEFTVPGTVDTDARIAPRLTVSGSGTMTAQMAQIVAFPKDAHTFPLQQRVRSTEHVGNFFRVLSGSSFSGPDERRYRTTEPLEHSFSNDGDHLAVTFSGCRGPLFYEERIFGSALTAMTDTTSFPIDHVIKWAYFELMDRQMRVEMMARNRSKDGANIPSIYRPLRNAALKSAKWSDYQPQLVNVTGRR